jgi:hypothetical protein
VARDPRSPLPTLPRIQTASAVLQRDSAGRGGPAPAPAYSHEYNHEYNHGRYHDGYQDRSHDRNHDYNAHNSGRHYDLGRTPVGAQHGGSHHHHRHIDMGRLNAIYAAHAASFWSALAHEYDPDASPAALQQAWRAGACCSASSTPITPVSSPGDAVYDHADERVGGGGGGGAATGPAGAMTGAAASATAMLRTPASLPPPARDDRTRISSLLGIDADPLSPSERELVRRTEHERRM